MFGRQKLAALVAEFLGTGALTLVFLNLQRSTLGVPYFIGIGVALTAVFVALVMRTEVSRVHLNPAVTFGLWTARRVTTVRAVAFIISQCLGAWGAYWLYVYFSGHSMPAVHTAFTGHILVAEALGTGLVAFGWAASMFKRNDTGSYSATVALSYVAGLIISGMALASAGMMLAMPNPAFALGTHAWDVFGGLGWGNFVLGPAVGAVIGANVYVAFFAPSAELVQQLKTSTAKVKSTAKRSSKRAKAKA